MQKRTYDVYLRGGGSLKASLAKVFSLAKNEQENSEQEIKMGCHSKLDLESYQLGVLQGLQGVGLKAQPTVDSHMLSLREGQSPTKQSTCLYGLPRILTNARNDKMAGICERDGLISHNALSPYRPNALLPRKLAFTMAEILLSLTIIGVVAAITLPSLTGNINERTWHTQRKALYSRMSQAVALMPALNGYGSSDDWAGTAAEVFVANGLSKVLKVNNICSHDKLLDCGLPNKIISEAGSKIDLPVKISELNPSLPVATQSGAPTLINTYAAGFETANGESILAFYNPKCISEDILKVGTNAAGNMSGYYFKENICVNFVFDLNGKKGPNTIGKDMGFISVINPTDSRVVMPIYATKMPNSLNWQNALKACREADNEYRLATIDEWMSIFWNRALVVDYVGKPWSATSIDSEKAWTVGFSIGLKYPTLKSGGCPVYCFKRM